MASQYIKEQVQFPVNVLAEDFTYTLGEWAVPTQHYQPAKLNDATALEATAQVDIDPTKKNNITIRFDLHKPQDNYGWGKDSNLSVEAKVGENGTPVLHSINDTYVSMDPSSERSIHTYFPLAPNFAAQEKKLYFRLFDTTEGPKVGLVVCGATISGDDSLGN